MFASKHSHHCIPTRGHLRSKIFYIPIFARRHLHRVLNTCTGIIMNKICISIPAWDICIMTYPLEDIHISISARRHLHRVLNTCTGIIMNKPCVSIPTGDIWIMEITFASLSGSICIRNKKSRFASCFVCIHRGLTSSSVVKSLSIAY